MQTESSFNHWFIWLKLLFHMNYKIIWRKLSIVGVNVSAYNVKICVFFFYRIVYTHEI